MLKTFININKSESASRIDRTAIPVQDLLRFALRRAHQVSLRPGLNRRWGFAGAADLALFERLPIRKTAGAKRKSRSSVVAKCNEASRSFTGKSASRIDRTAEAQRRPVWAIPVKMYYLVPGLFKYI